jgi:hypothetical protein
MGIHTPMAEVGGTRPSSRIGRPVATTGSRHRTGCHGPCNWCPDRPARRCIGDPMPKQAGGESELSHGTSRKCPAISHARWDCTSGCKVCRIFRHTIFRPLVRGESLALSPTAESGAGGVPEKAWASLDARSHACRQAQEGLIPEARPTGYCWARRRDRASTPTAMCQTGRSKKFWGIR